MQARADFLSQNARINSLYDFRPEYVPKRIKLISRRFFHK